MGVFRNSIHVPFIGVFVQAFDWMGQIKDNITIYILDGNYFEFRQQFPFKLLYFDTPIFRHPYLLCTIMFGYHYVWTIACLARYCWDTTAQGFYTKYVATPMFWKWIYMFRLKHSYFLTPKVSTPQYSHTPMFQLPLVRTHLCFYTSMFQLPTSLCFDTLMFWHYYVRKALWSYTRVLRHPYVPTSHTPIFPHL